MCTPTACTCASFRYACAPRRRPSSITGTGKSAYYMVKVLLAIFVGLARRRRHRAGLPRPRAAEPDLMDVRIQIVAIVADAVLLLVLLELVRRRSLPSATHCCGCSARRAARAGGLARPARAGRDLLGVAYPPNALFLLAFGFVLVLLLHFSPRSRACRTRRRCSRNDSRSSKSAPARKPAEAEPASERELEASIRDRARWLRRDRCRSRWSWSPTRAPLNVAKTLTALGGQLAEGDEVVVVDNTSRDETTDVVRKGRGATGADPRAGSATSVSPGAATSERRRPRQSCCSSSIPTPCRRRTASSD